MISAPFRRMSVLLVGTLVMTTFGVMLASIGCSNTADESSASGLPKVKVCYIGLTCEPPIYAAYELGFFKDEGLDVELVRTDWDSMRDGLGLGRFDATHTLIMYMLKPIDQGLNVKLTGGIHSGCLRVQAGIKTNIHRVEDLKGKRIGISHMGSPPFLFASRVLANHGLDPQKDVEWVVFPSDAMELALDRGEVDAVANSEPIGTILLTNKKVRKVVDQATDAPYADEFCCVTALNGAFAEKNPKAAAGVTRALLKGAKWVEANKAAAAKLSVEKGYLASTAELNVEAIRDVTYRPAVAKAQQDILRVAKEMKAAGFLNLKGDPEELTRRAWLDLEGASDEWIQTVQVDRVPGGALPPRLSPDHLKSLVFAKKSCCSDGCCGEMQFVALLTGKWAQVKPRVWEPVSDTPGSNELVH